MKQKRKKRRQLTGFEGRLAAVLALGITLFCIVVLSVYQIDPVILRATVLAFCAVLVFMLYPGWSGAAKRVHLVDYLLSLASLSAWVYFLLEYKSIIYRAGVMPTPLDVVFGLIVIFTILEMVRRTIGSVLAIFALILLVYAVFGQNLPGILSHVGYSYKRVSSYVYSASGIYGMTLGVIRYVIVFIMFGAFMEAMGATQFVLELAQAITGRARGGPGKMAVLASALFGSLSGSTVANVVTTGTFTIPLMKKVGYKPHFAAAVETAASSGGQILPPVMGSAAFLMADLIGVPYVTIARMALLPAILYFVAVFWMLDLEARKENLRGLTKEEVPVLKELFLNRGYMILPIIILIVCLVIIGFSPVLSGFISTISCIVLSYLKKETRIGFKVFINCLQKSAITLAPLVATAGTAGILIAVLGLTGLGVRLGIGLLNYTGNNLFFTLVITMVLAIIVGMGQPSIPAYLIASAVAATSIIALGVPLATAHLFVFYFATFSNVTPPVAVASYVAANLADANPLRTAVTGLKLCVAAFLVPYVFIWNSGLLLEGSILNILFAIFSGLIGIFALGIALEGWLVRHTAWWLRIILLGTVILSFHPSGITDVIAFVIICLIVVSEVLIVKAKNRKNNLTFG